MTLATATLVPAILYGHGVVAQHNARLRILQARPGCLHALCAAKPKHATVQRPLPANHPPIALIVRGPFAAVSRCSKYVAGGNVYGVRTCCHASPIGSGNSNLRGLVRQTQKREQASPRRTNARRTIQFLVEPVTRNLALSESAYMRVDEDVGIDQHHLKGSRPFPILSTTSTFTSRVLASTIAWVSRSLPITRVRTQ